MVKILSKVVAILLKILISLLLFLELHANFLEETYYIKSDDIYLSSILNDVQNDVLLFSLEQGRDKKRVTSKELLKLLNKHGYENFTESGKYVNFIKKSPINTEKMELALRELYEKSYTGIQIHAISILPRSYIDSLDDDYILNIKTKNLTKNGILNVKTKENKKIFFDYVIDADIFVYTTTTTIQKGAEFSALNTVQKSVPIQKFKAMPLQGEDLSAYQSKHLIKETQILTVRDVEGVLLVKKGSSVNVKIDNADVAISMSAEALKNGRLNDIITVKKSDGKKFRVTVIGKNKVEMR